MKTPGRLTVSRLPKAFAPIIAEEPYDDMGREFQQVFGAWIDATSPRKEDGTTPQHFQMLAFDLFQRRLALAQKYRTFFAGQMVAGERELWRERFTGAAPGHWYSFALRRLPRTQRFFRWCVEFADPPNQSRAWEAAIKPLPSLPLAPHATFALMPVWAHLHEPQFRARREGPFYVRRIHLGPEVYLVEHPDNHWVPGVRMEAGEHWFRANDPHRALQDRVRDLACFEWLWFWLNPFGRAGALTGDALSLLTQKQMIIDGHAVHVRPGYYHQDCEAFLLPWGVYVAKRTNDLLTGFVPRFSMEVATLSRND